MHFFKNGTGWCVRHDPRSKLQAPSTKPHAPIFRKNSFGNRTRSLAESCLTSDGGTRSMAARDLVQASSSEEPSENLRSTKLREQQAASFKPQATSCKLQAASFKLHDSWTTVHLNKFRGPRTKGLGYDKCILWMCLMEGNLVWWKFKFITSCYF